MGGVAAVRPDAFFAGLDVETEVWVFLEQLLEMLWGKRCTTLPYAFVLTANADVVDHVKDFLIRAITISKEQERESP